MKTSKLVLMLFIIAIIAIGYYAVTHIPQAQIVNNTPTATQLTILIPENLNSYIEVMNTYVSDGGTTNPSLTWPYEKKTVLSTSTQDTILATTELAAQLIPTQAGNPAVSYLKIKDGTAYVALRIDLDGYAGVSFAQAKLHPIVEKNLLQFPEIKTVKFTLAPGDKVSDIIQP